MRKRGLHDEKGYDEEVSTLLIAEEGDEGARREDKQCTHRRGVARTRSATSRHLVGVILCVVFEFHCCCN